jgi:para-aminobenzoate synthetase/4-amino-4-deoxychorismate lyase
VVVGDLQDSTGPVLVGLAETPVYSRDVLLFHKHGDRGRYERYRSARPECQDVILWNERRELTESTIANLAVRTDGRWWTPSLSSGLLPGVQRARLIASGRLAERVLTVDELAQAQELALVSSLRGWRRAVLVTNLRHLPTVDVAAECPIAVPGSLGGGVGAIPR